MSRFGLSLGFGDKTVKEVCELNGVDCRTFLIVVNFMAEGFSRLDGDKDDISIPALIDYLRQAHIYFLDFSLPAIRRKLIEGMDDLGGGKIVHAYVPLAEMFGYSTDLRSKTQGRGNYSMFFDRYEPVPKNVQDKVLANHAK